MMNKKNKPNKTALLIIILILGGLVSACLARDEVPGLPETQELVTAEPSDDIDEPIPTLPPSGKNYTVTGLNPDQTLSLYAEPSLNADITGTLASFSTNLKPLGEVLKPDGARWVQVKYQDQIGWVPGTFLAEQKGDLPDNLIKLGQTTLAALQQFQYDRLEGLVHPDLCLRISPYPYLNPDNRILCAPDLEEGYLSTEELLWGYFDGSGEPILLTFRSYHDRFIYDQNFFHSPVIGLDQEVSSGNAINNIPEIFPDGKMIEYHFPGIDPQYGGMDWRSLRLVFLQVEAEWYLVAIVHGEWTI